jgi:xanthine dehydrogenase accessory factor
MTSILEAVADLEKNNTAGALCTIVRTRGATPRREGCKMLVYADGQILGTVGGGEVENRVKTEALDSLRDGRTRLLEYSMIDPSKGDVGVCGGTVEVYVEPILPRPSVIVIGGGHVGKAVVQLAHWLGFLVGVSDDRIELCTPDTHPDADFFYPCTLSQLPTMMNITPQVSLVLTTRGSDVDIEGLPALLQTDAGYIGVIGSRRRWSFTKQALLNAGMSEDALCRVHSPMGLELNAETPEEIALSILSEIVMLRYRGTGKSMQA